MAKVSYAWHSNAWFLRMPCRHCLHPDAPPSPGKHMLSRQFRPFFPCTRAHRPIAGRFFHVTSFFVALLFAPAAQALDPVKAITQYIHDVWQTEHGLPQNSVPAIAQ